MQRVPLQSLACYNVNPATIAINRLKSLPKFKRTVPEQEWNTLTVISKNADYNDIPGSILEWHVNGEKLGTAKLGRQSGHIVLCGSMNEGPIQVRNIRIRKLGADGKK